MSPNNGGQAFPGPRTYGQSLRDYFAGQTLTTYRPNTHLKPKEIAETCYILADAMIKERDRT